MTENGVTTTNRTGQEQYETFTRTVNRKKKTYVQYDYRDHDGELFSCVKPTLDDCRKARDAWLAAKAPGESSTAYSEVWQKVTTLETTRKTFVAESKMRIAALSAKIDTAKEKAALLQDSKCPMRGGGRCFWRPFERFRYVCDMRLG